MKKLSAAMVIIVVMLAPMAVLAGETAVGSRDMVNLGLVDMPADQFRALQDMVAGRYHRNDQAPNAANAETVNLGFMTMPRVDIEGIENLMAGREVDQETIATMPHEVVSVGLVDMERGEFEALKRIVLRDIVDWDGTFADAPTGDDANAGQ